VSGAPRIAAIDTFHVSVPVRPLADGGIAPYRGSQDPTGVSSAGSLLVAVRADDGTTGWGEMNTGFPAAVDRALMHDWAAPALLGQPVGNVQALIERLDSPYWPHLGRRALASAVETALWDLLGRHLDAPVSTLLGGALRTSIPLAPCLGLTSIEQACGYAVDVLARGHRVLKTKIATDVEEAVERVRAITDVTGGRLRLRLDANQALTRTAAAELATRLAGLPVEYIEQPLPVADVDGMRMLRQRSAVPVAINEDAYLLTGVVDAVRADATDAAVVDLEPAGGIGGLVTLARTAQSLRLPLAHHCGWDLGVKAAAMAHVVAAVPAFTLASDSTYAEHLDDVLERRLEIADGAMRVPQGPGLGITVDEDKVRALAAEES